AQMAAGIAKTLSAPATNDDATFAYGEGAVGTPGTPVTTAANTSLYITTNLSAQSAKLAKDTADAISAEYASSGLSGVCSGGVCTITISSNGTLGVN
ncbi:MAG: hypothetical protein ACP5GF_13890, partial [Thiomonas sp.]